MRSRSIAALAALAASLTILPSASAAPRVLATVTSASPISAHAGRVAWSVPVGGAWRLSVSNGTSPLMLPIRPRTQPFDVDLGSDADGRPVATFSRCTTAPEPRGAGIAPWTGSGCRIRVVDLATGVERSAGIPRPVGSSDTTPSMWRGRIAFARRDRHHGEVSQVLLWTPGKRNLRTLRHGAMPTKCPFRTGCEGSLRRGAVTGLDLGARLATFAWWIEAPGVVGHAGWEVRADDLRSGRSTRVGTGYVGEVCTEGIDGQTPSTPSAAGTRVFWGELQSRCYKLATKLKRYDVGAPSAAIGDLPGVVLRVTRGSGTLYGLVAPAPAGDVPPACDAPGAPCTIVALDEPTLAPARTKIPPIFFI